MERIEVQEIGAEGLLRVDLSLFSADTVKKALMALSDRISGDLKVHEDVLTVNVRLRPSGGVSLEINEVLDDLRVQILDEDLRQKIPHETQDARNLILAHTFSNTKLVDTGE